jgi:hypothetical protein
MLLAVVVAVTGCGQAGSPPVAESSPSTTASPPRITPFTLLDGEVGVAYEPVALVAIGGGPPYVWDIAEGALPAGIKLSAEGTLAGTPQASGNYSFAARVADQRRLTNIVWSSVAIAPALSARATQSRTWVVERGHAAGAFATQSGGIPPYTYSIASGAVPAGTTLDGLSLRGTFSSAGNFSFTLAVTDRLGAKTTVAASYLVFAPIAFAAPPSGQSYNAVCQGTISSGCSTSVSFSGGYPGVTPRMTWYPANLSGAQVACTDTVARGCIDLEPPILGANTVRIVFDADRTGVPGGIGWDGVVVVTLTDPMTGAKTTAHIHVIVVR